MRNSSFRLVMFAAVLIWIPTSLQAQLQLFGKPLEEIRVDFAGLSLGETTTLSAALPGSISLAFFLSNKLAIEPTAGLAYVSSDAGGSATTLSIGVMAPYYLAGDRGRTGYFVAPMLSLVKAGSAELSIDLGADVGTKRKVSDTVSLRLAGTLRAGDRTGDQIAIGATAGISIFLK